MQQDLSDLKSYMMVMQPNASHGVETIRLHRLADGASWHLTFEFR